MDHGWMALPVLYTCVLFLASPRRGLVAVTVSAWLLILKTKKQQQKMINFFFKFEGPQCVC